MAAVVFKLWSADAATGFGKLFLSIRVCLLNVTHVTSQLPVSVLTADFGAQTVSQEGGWSDKQFTGPRQIASDGDQWKW
jgi:hypothetical protein